ISRSLELLEVIFLCFSGSTVFLIRHFLETIVQILQLSFFCIAADYTVNEALMVSDAIYNSKWYSKYSHNNRALLLLVMQRSQKCDPFTAGGLFMIDSKTLITVNMRVESVMVSLYTDVGIETKILVNILSV
ncbi:hypothetical protein ILUMI_01395, partial [Ignelater luminosus]